MGILWSVASISHAEEDRPSLHPELEPFRELLGKTWAGQFPDAPDGSPVLDVVRYERALNGMVVSSTYFRGDESTLGHAAEYAPAPKRKVVFR